MTLIRSIGVILLTSALALQAGASTYISWTQIDVPGHNLPLNYASEFLVSWYPQVVDYVHVNDTVKEDVEYSIIIAQPLARYNWSVDGLDVIGKIEGNTYSHTHTWDNDSVGFHTVIFRGNNAETKIEFRWYVNAYEIGGYRGGSLFDVIDDALENHVTDIKIRMFKYKIAKRGDKSAITASVVNQLHDEIASRQMTREALRKDFKDGNVTVEQYVAALKQAQREARYNMKFVKELATIAKKDLRDEESSKEFEKIYEKETENIKKKVDEGTQDKSREKDKDKENKKKGNGKD